ncbi:MAG: PQQ-binding-like beta-propeller repeat protein [Thermoguttaceae bacterium]|jgi:outer membrane protein assembly factor BamB|nr:PQQ-binding-like beta-propeller repeat protein [Thermoguttaceae bacterium]
MKRSYLPIALALLILAGCTEMAADSDRAQEPKPASEAEPVADSEKGFAKTAADPNRWPRFRGPNGEGVGQAAGIPETWTDDDYRWKVELPGIGFSSPVVWDDRVYVTSTIEDERLLVVLCLDTADGSVLWKQHFNIQSHPAYKDNRDASTSPAVDEDRIYVTWGTTLEYVVVALDRREGREIWRRDLGPFVAEDGFGASPILAGEVVILMNDQDPDGESSVVALDRKTGETRWKVDRKSEKATFSTPTLFKPEGGRPQVIVTSCAHGITSLDPDSGAIQWELEDVFELRTTGSPLVVAGTIFASNGSGRGGKYLVAVRAGVPEQGIEPEVLYRVEQAAPYVITPVAHWPLVFLWTDRGIVTCLDGPSGKVHWRERVGGDYLGSPVWVGERLYTMSNSGEMVVLAAADEFELLARFDLGEPTHSTPAVAGGVMYLRTYSHLMALGSE